MHTFRYALRTLGRYRSYALLGIVTLGLAICANTVVFSIARGLLLRPLPIQDPERVVFLVPGTLYTMSFPAYRDVRAQNRTFVEMAAYRIEPMGLASESGSRRVWAYLATGNYFSMLGIRPALGRFFTEADDRAPGAAPFVVLSHAFWTRQFNADPAIVNRTVRLNDTPFTVIGVAPPEFFGTEVFYRPDMWVPFVSMQQLVVAGRVSLDSRFPKNTMVIGRLQPAATTASASADLTRIFGELARQYPRSDSAVRVELVRPGLLGQAARSTASSVITVVMVLAGLVLLAACANLGGLLASRILDRTREFGLRLALGAHRFAVARDIGVETLIVVAAGTVFGWGIASAILRAVTNWSPADLPFQVDVRPDPVVITFTAMITIGAAALASVAAIRRAWAADIVSLTTARSSTTRRRWGAREWLLATQMAVCTVLLTASAVALKAERAAASAPLGIAPAGLSMVFADTGLTRYSTEQMMQFDGRVLDAVSRLPGVTRAALATSVPLSTDQSTTGAYRENETEFTPAHSFQAVYYYVSPGYFATAGTRLLAGRDFSASDDTDAPRVAIVNETFARRLTGSVDAVGRRIRTGGALVEIIGVAEDGKYVSLTESPRGALYRPRTQAVASDASSVGVLVRSTLPAAQIVPQVRAALAALDPQVPVLYQGSANDVMAIAFLPNNAAGIALGAFGLLALLLAVTGVYSVAAFAVSRRTREIGIRVAIGARRQQVLRTVLGRTAACVGIGGALGLSAGAAASQLLSAVLYRASARDPLVLGSVVMLLAAIALLATLAPAHRALAIEPSAALRET
jgi:predicted permease